MIGKLSNLYVDDDGYISFYHNINKNIFLTWNLHRFGWSVFFDDILIHEFIHDGITYPSNEMFSYVENFISHFRCTSFGNWEVSWIDNKTYSRKHHQFDEFVDAINFYKELELKGEL